MRTPLKILFIATAAMFFALQAKAVLFWARPYDPNLQRWIQRDPIGETGGLNLYEFVANNPVNFTDPLGLFLVISPSPFPGQEDTYGPYTMDIPGPGPSGSDSDRLFLEPTLNDGPIQDDPWGEMLLPGGGLLMAPAKGATLCVTTPKWIWPAGKGVPKMLRQFQQRGWTPQQISDAIQYGKQFPAKNLINPGNSAIRYVNPTTGQSVVIDTVTKEIIHVGGPGFKY